MMRSLRPAATAPWLLALCFLLAGCGGGKAPPPSFQVKEGGVAVETGYKIGKPYPMGGVWYYPAEDYFYDETGIASCYGPDYHAKMTANGELFDQNDVTAAHRTLPMPSIVRVTNLDNGRAIILRINDRGPFAHGRILDLSRRAAELLEVDAGCSARLRVQIMADESRNLALQLRAGEETPLDAAPREAVQTESLAAPAGRAAPPPKNRGAKAPPTAAAPPPAELAAIDRQSLQIQTVEQGAPRSTQLFIQAGVFTRFDNANRMSAALSGVGPAVISQTRGKTGSIFHVRLGPLPGLDEADAVLEKVIASGYPDAKLIAD
jgi:rare lipoprotein A